ncbi:MAG: hypothetical protein KDG52_00395 [Rhodocyclaceae bacterium]|nr:hypothetical protein [Rhodocyclaceae bacterium]
MEDLAVAQKVLVGIFAVHATFNALSPLKIREDAKNLNRFSKFAIRMKYLTLGPAYASLAGLAAIELIGYLEGKT